MKFSRSSRATGPKIRVVLAELAGHGTENTGAAEFACIVQKNTGIVVETDIGTVGATDLFLGANHDGARDSTLLGVSARNSTLDGDDDGVADGRITVVGTAKDADAEDFLCTAVVGHL